MNPKVKFSHHTNCNHPDIKGLAEITFYVRARNVCEIK
jgi:predicted RNA-binding protein with PUA-like domain